MTPSNATIITHAPVPQPTPPPTYDILGLSHDEIVLIATLLGELPWDPTRSKLFDKFPIELYKSSMGIRVTVKS